MNVEKKLDGFMKIALDEAVEHKRQVEEDLERQFTTACDEYRKSVGDAAKKKLRQEYVNAQSLKNKEVIQATTESKKAVIDLRNQLLEKIFENITAKLREYVKAPEYGINLLEEIKSAVLNVETAVIYLTPEDMKHVRGKINIGGVSYIETYEDFIGGYKMKFNDNALIDNTYRNKLNEAKRNTNIFRID